jgi:proteasome lid subunit RPN8/RPN11
MIAHGVEDLPIEACGYLAEKDGIVQKLYRLKNMDDSGIHFTFDPAEQFTVLRDMRECGLAVRAVYHSHPATPARPSAEDIKLAVDPHVSYVIVSLLGKTPVAKSFEIKNKLVEAEEIVISGTERPQNG